MFEYVVFGGGVIRRYDFVVVSMVLLEEVFNCGGRL